MTAIQELPQVHDRSVDTRAFDTHLAGSAPSVAVGAGDDVADRLSVTAR